MRSFTRFAVPTIFLCAASTMARSAAACGGTFCDRGPQFMSVDQTGENIIFVMEPGQVEAHIQIQYRGDAAHFSWIVPVSALPDVEVGSEALFDRLLAATVPRFGLQSQFDACGGLSAGGTGAGGATNTTGGVSNPATADAGVNIVQQKVVGAFDVTVLSGSTTDDLLAWLDTNGYQTPTNAGALFTDYVARGYFFVAVKLTGGAGVDQIHPLVVRYTGNNPCVPIKLTAVAATEDMGIRTFFLGTRRVVPRNYKHIVANPVMLDWSQLGTNYTNLVGRAADSPVANGQAFVTEYAGPAAVVGSAPIASSNWDATPFATAQAVDVVRLLTQQGLMFCAGTYCSYQHPLILPLLREFLPPPATLPGSSGAPAIVNPELVESAFYGCLSCYASSIDQTQWNAAAFASALSSRVIQPARHADDLLANWPYLTRMFTTISPAEMTADPEFWERDDLGDVNVSGSAVRRVTCSGASGVTLPDGRQVALTPQRTWPGFSAQMPFAERIEEIPLTGDPIVLVNNTERINSQLKLWDDSQGWPPPSSAIGGASGTGGSGGAVGAIGVGGTGAGGAIAGGGGLGDTTGQSHDKSTIGCACRTSGKAPPYPAASAVLTLLGALIARRKKRNRATGV
jgi:MYXO-CTERM domain-containing protein